MQINGLPSSPDFIKSLAHDLRWRILTILSQGDYRVNELVEQIDQPFNLVSYHLKKLLKSEIVRFRRSDADRRDLYYSLDLDRIKQHFQAAMQAIHPAFDPAIDDHTSPLFNHITYRRVLFLCTGNSARSQMAEGLLRHASKGQVAVFSAGSDPEAIHPLAIETLRKRGIDISQHTSKHLELFVDQQFDRIITVCDRVREVCPAFPGCEHTIHWSIPDPSHVSDEVARRRAFDDVADELTKRIAFLLASL